MNDVKLGQLIDVDQKRDAIHIAIAPVVAAERLYPGQEIGFVTSSTERVGASGTHIGIVDPFLKAPVYPEQRFYMMLFPQTITSLRHEWTHPAFSAVEAENAKPDKSASEKWLREHAERLGLDLDDLIHYAECYLKTGLTKVEQGSTQWRDNFSPTEFWPHYEAYTGFTVQDKEAGIFCCTC